MAASLLLASLPVSAEEQGEMLTLADSVMEEAWDASPLHLRKLLFVEGPATAFGAYVPRRDDEFGPGETLYVYAEPEAFGYGSQGPLNAINIEFDLLVYDEAGDLLYRQDAFGAFDFVSHARNRELMFNADISLSDLPGGAYRLGLRVRDLDTDEEDTADLPFTIRTAAQ